MTTMDFFEALKQERERRNITLAEISDATLINLNMLEALERGNVDVLPQAYVRAFIKEYAGAIGLDKQETLSQYDRWLSTRTAETSIAAATPTPAAIDVKPLERWPDRLQQMMPSILHIGAAVVLLLLVDIVLWTVLEKEPAPQVREKSFLETARESEEKAAVEDSIRGLPVHRRTPPPVIKPTDSLTLTAITTDSVWMQIVIDDTLRREYLMFPNTSLSWKARDAFLLAAVGNPTAVTFTLNTRRLSLPIRSGFVTRNVRITRDSLQVH